MSTEQKNPATQQTAPAKKKVDLSTIKGFEEVWKNYEKTIMSLLVNKYGISVEEFMANAVNSVRKNPDLLKCTPKSLFGAMLLSAECGLKFNTPSQHAYIIPYKGEAQFQIGYQGLIEIMYRNPKVVKIDGQAVFENDTFDYGYGLTPYLTHKPFRGGNRGSITSVYAVVKLQGSDEPVFCVVEKQELDAIKNLSPAKNSKFSPYNSGTDVHHWMEVKVAIKKISKLIPKTSEIANVIDLDNKVSSRFKASADILENPNDIAGVHFSEETIFGGAFDSYAEVVEEPAKTTETATNKNVATPIEPKVENKTTAPEMVIPKTISVEGKSINVAEKKEVKKETKYGVSLTDVENISENLEIGKTEEKNDTPNSSLFDE
jgi:recombination protein RecT